MSGVIFYGDPHGEWRPLFRACAEERPDGIVILGDCELAMPLRQQVKPLIDLGIRVRWIPGNHDTDCPEWHDRLFEDFSEGNLHGRWGAVGDLLVAGLGGVFKERVWYPRHSDAEPLHMSRRDYLRRLPRAERWRAGLPLHMRDGIFPEDAAGLRGLRVHVLATHEGPSSHRHGFVGIDRVADACRARLVIHGHHHENVQAVLPNGVRVHGLAKAEVLRLRWKDVV